MKDWFEFRESFDKPYRHNLRKSESDAYRAEFRPADGSEIKVLIFSHSHSDDKKDEVWTVDFRRNGSMAATGEGDSQKIFATVLDIVKKFVKKEKPYTVQFSAEKPEKQKTLPHGHPDRKKDMGSREKLYKRMVQRFAGQLGYKSSFESDYTGTDFRLEKR